ncbi:hypothetical protein SKAU_G00111680 [Synaphobranchus kaupii]|uniref:Uncharacterized protein n=1 Tax=Synaphobranchus kaupii TaxID=118154 RepID=A0A9Q1G1D4_SYNKA|nr:hypothetical protein SKAU_G00111680 [Synaphobranchus kaupii]
MFGKCTTPLYKHVLMPVTGSLSYFGFLRQTAQICDSPQLKTVQFRRDIAHDGGITQAIIPVPLSSFSH